MSTNSSNREEQLVIDCLRSQGYNEIEFEPDGNIPPDILLNRKVAIEVRRLNKNISKGDEFEGLEQVEYPIHNVVTGILNSYTSIKTQNSALVSYSFRRPLPPLKELRKGILDKLSRHESMIDQRRQYSVGDNFRIEFWPLSERMQNLFMYAASSDQDSGGYIVGLMHSNLKLVAEKKDRKILSHKSKYAEWWLALVDNIGYIMDEHDLLQFYELPKIKSSFDRILMVSPINASRWLFLYE